MTWYQLSGLTFFAVLLWAGYHYLWPAHGVRDVYVGRCDARASIAVKSSAYSHPLDFEQGDATGYGLFLRVSGQPSDILIWDDAFSERELQVAFPTPYVGWDLAIDWNVAHEKGGGQPQDYRGPLQTWEFAPVPQGLPSSQARIFEPPSGAYSRDATPSAPRTPPLMNIFLPADKISETQFTGLADCLGRHREEINSAFVRLRADFPFRSQHFYFALRLGGIVRGMPPWSDDRYVEQIRLLYGDTAETKALPDAGRFTLYRGQSASGIVGGRKFRLSISPTGRKQIAIDGITLPYLPAEKDVDAVGLHDAKVVGDRLIIGQSICHTDKLNECQKWFQISRSNNDGSTTFEMSLRAADHTYVSDVEGLRVFEQQKQ